MSDSFWEVCDSLQKKSESFVVVTILNSRGSTPQDIGAKAVITANGLRWGTVGGGKVEARAITHSQNLLLDSNKKNPESITWNLQTDIGMSCGGEVTYLFEIFRENLWPIAIFGAGHVSQALIRTLLNLNCQITCIDSRIEWLDKLPASSKIKKIMTNDMATAVNNFNSDFYFLTITQGHAVDLPILKNIFSQFSNAPYIGGIGSTIKAMKLKKELIEFGISPEVLEKFHCPVGLKLGTNHPYEIAISITAEMLQTRDLQNMKKK